MTTENNKKESDWKGKFEHWLINNLQITSRSNVQLIVDHVERYIRPATPPSIEGEIKSKEEYNPIGCEHKKDNGWSSWECLSTSTGSGPDVDFDVNIMVCMKCGDIKIIGRRLDKGKINYFSEIFDINYPDAVAAIVKACNFFNEETEGYIPFTQQPASQFTASKEKEYREALGRIENICLKDSIGIEQMQKDFKNIYGIIQEVNNGE